jgi:hypothetical protein
VLRIRIIVLWIREIYFRILKYFHMKISQRVPRIVCISVPSILYDSKKMM